jgi:ankyrin repeat protein
MDKRLLRLFRNGIVDVNAKDENGWPVFTWVVCHKDETAAKLLLETGKVDLESINPFGHTPLLQASPRGERGYCQAVTRYWPRQYQREGSKWTNAILACY